LTHFEIDEGGKSSMNLGLIERTSANTFVFIRDRHELKYDHLYYLYFRDKPDKSLAYNPPKPPQEE